MVPRLTALCDLSVAATREYVGLHHYDGVVQDLSPAGVSAGLARLGGPAEPDPHDEAHLATFERLARLELGELQRHRANPLHHLSELDLSCYEREYAPAEQRAAARRRHLAAWPDAVDNAVAALDRVPAPVADALLPAAHGLAAGVDPAEPGGAAALAAHGRLVAHLERAAADGDPDPALGRAALERLLATGEALAVDL